MKKLFGRHKTKESTSAPVSQSPPVGQQFLSPQQNQNGGDFRTPSPQSNQYQPYPPQGYLSQPYPQSQGYNPYAGYGGQSPYPQYQQPYYSQSPFPQGPPPPNQPFTSSPPPPNPPSFTPDQLALFTPEQRAQILQWSQESQSRTTSTAPVHSPPFLSQSPPIPAQSPPLPAQPVQPSPIPAPVPVAPPPTSNLAQDYQVPEPGPSTSPAPKQPQISSTSTSIFGNTVPPFTSENKHKEDSAHLLKDQANTLFENGDFDAAATYYTLALDYTPNNAVLLANRSSAYFSQVPPKLDEAIKDARAATELDPSYWKGWSRLGRYLLDKKDAPGAKMALEKAISLGGEAVKAPTRQALDKANQMLEAERQQTLPNIQNLSLNQPTASTSSVLPATSPNRATQSPVQGSGTNLSRRQSQSIAQRNYVAPNMVTAPETDPTDNLDRAADIPVTSGNDGLPSYTPNFDSADPSIRALSAQALVDQLNAVTNHLKVKNKGAARLRTLQTRGNIPAIQVFYSYMVTSELTARETGNIQPLHPSFGAMWTSAITIPGSTFLDMDMESSKYYTGRTPGTVGMSGYSEEYRAAKLPPSLNLMLCNYDPLPLLSTDTVISRLNLIRFGLPSIGQAETELRELLGPSRRTGLYVSTWQTQIADLCYALNRNEPATFADFSRSRNISNNTLGGPGQGIGLTNFLYQILLGAELLSRLWKEPVTISYAGLVTDPVSALLVLADQWMLNVDVVKSATASAGTPKYLLVSRVHQRQTDGLIRFAEMLKWPYMDEARRYIENAYNQLTSGQLKNFDMIDWLFGLAQPGKVFRHRIMSALVYASTSTRDYQSAPYYDSGLILPSRSYWPQKTVLGRVLGGLMNPKSTCGWIGPVPKPTKDITGWVVVTARQVQFPEPCKANPYENDGLEGLLNGAGGASTEQAIRELTRVEDWIVPVFSPRPADANDTVMFKNVNLEDLPPTPTEQQYRASLDFEINSAPVSYTLYTNPLFISAHPCVGTHVMHRKDIQKYTQHIVRVSQLKDCFVPENELLIIDATREKEEVVARAWCSERGRHAVVRRGAGCCFACALQMASGRQGLGLNVLIWS